MSIKIGHASCDENGKAIGTRKGDQTGKEICTRSWYDGKWNVCLECTDTKLAKKAAEIMQDICSDGSYGYSQPHRWTGYKSIVAGGGNISKGAGDFDCSSLVISCYILAGLDMAADGYTGNMRKRMLATGKFKEYTDAAHLRADNLAKVGNVYIREGHHVVMALEDGTGGYSLKQFIRDVQEATGAKVDGIAGKETLAKTITVSATKNRKHAVVRTIQQYLNASGYDCGNADGIAGKKFTAAVKAFQKAKGCAADGEITAGGRTWKKLLGMI